MVQRPDPGSRIGILRLMSFKPRTSLALLFSIFGAGAGHLYAGRFRRALFIYCTVLIGKLVALALALYWAVVPAFGLGAALVLFGLWSIVDAGRSARAMAVHDRRWFERWYVVVGILCLHNAMWGVLGAHLRAGYIEAFKVSSGAMEPTLEIGDHILVDKRQYRADRPARGDVVVVRVPSGDPDDPWAKTIKRVVAIEGDRVELKIQQLYLNGVPAAESYAVYKQGGRKGFPASTVPRDSVLLLGDNRDQSRDGRFWEGRFTSNADLLGKVKAIYFRYDFRRIGQVVEDTGPVPAAGESAPPQ